MLKFTYVEGKYILGRMAFILSKAIQKHGVQDVASEFRYNACFAPPTPRVIFFLFLGLLGLLGQKVAYVKANRMLFAHQNRLMGLGGGGLRLPAPQTEPLRARQEYV